MNRYKHYGWPVSPYSAKTRAYLKYKQIPFDDIEPTARQFLGPIKKAVGRAVMPTMQRPDGSWMQDTSEIIDELELTHPARPVSPSTPKQKVVSSLLELFADEWIIPLAIHYRWNYPECAESASRKLGAELLPIGPNPLRRALARWWRCRDPRL